MSALKYLAGFALVLAAAVFLAAGTASAQTSAVNCGDTVNGNVSLNHDLICPSTDGLIVDSPNTTIHLNGHKIICPNDALPCWDSGLSGVFTEYNNTQIIGPGTIQGFYANITLYFSSANTIKNLNTNWGASHASQYGIFALAGASNFVQHVTDTGSGFSIFSVESVNNGFDNNVSNLAGTGDEGPGTGGGIFVGGDTQDIVHGNVVSHALGDTEEPTGGITLDFADHTQVWQNKVDHTLVGPGFADICSTYSTYTGNTATANNYDGFTFYHGECQELAPKFANGAPALKATYPADHYAGLQVTFTGNTSTKNGFDGAFFRNTDGSEDPSCIPFGYPCGGSEVSGNKLNGNGAVFGGGGIETDRTYASHFHHNTTNSNVNSGLLFYEPAADGINGNTSKQNHEDGLTIYWDFRCVVSGPFGGCDPQFVNYNTLVHNSEFGGFANDIVASIGNVANNNGTAPIDCVNINCVAHAAAAASPALAAKAGKLPPARTATAKVLPAFPAGVK